MFIILGASGHVGSAVTRALLAKGLPVTAVVHRPDGIDALAAQGARATVIDVKDSDALRDVFRTGVRAFLLNPPADVSSDTDAEERESAQAIATALKDSGLEKVVLESTFGARPGAGIGDLSVLHEFEQAALATDIPVTIQRGAYYFSNWDAQLAEAQEGSLTTMFPADLKLPMVAPDDLGVAAAARLTEPFGDTDLHLVEGPARYSVRDVADAFARALGRPVKVVSLPRANWHSTYRKLGFSEAAATAYTRMTEATVEGNFPSVEDTERGETTIDAYILALVRRSHQRGPSRAADPA